MVASRALAGVGQHPAEELKTKASMTPVPIPSELALMLSAHVAARGGETVLNNAAGQQQPRVAADRPRL